MQFWHTQPVFHIYNLKYWFNPPGFINIAPPAMNKFVNLTNNKLIMLDEDTSASSTGTSASSTSASSPSTSEICKFIKDYYVIHPSATYNPSEEDIMAYLQCANHPAFFNVYQEPRLTFTDGVPSEKVQQEIIGVTSSRVLNVKLNLAKGVNKKSFPAYYVDNLCVKPDYRKKGIPPQMIQTFYYNVARVNSKVNAYMFKREGKLNAIVPLVCFDTFCFDISRIHPDYALTAAMSILAIDIQTLNIFIDFIKAQTKTFECVVLPDLSSVLNLIKLGKLKIYGIIFNGELIACYVFRPIEMYYADKKTVECIAILSRCDTPTILIAGFTMSLAKVRANAELLLIENTADSTDVINYLSTNLSVTCKFKSPTAFFLYNYACYSAKNTKTLLLY
jgi:hypothetical protein